MAAMNFLCRKGSDLGLFVPGFGLFTLPRQKSKSSLRIVISQWDGKIIDCTIKRTRAEEIEDALENHLSEILIRAGYFDKIEQQIRKVSIVRPENLKAQRLALQKQLDEVQKTIHTTFKNQSTLSQESEAIKLFTDELESLGRTRRILAAELESLKAKENQEEDVSLSVIDLKERLESFNRGWKKATVAMKKDLL
jgi:hypothetical protein